VGLLRDQNVVIVYEKPGDVRVVLPQTGGNNMFMKNITYMDDAAAMGRRVNVLCSTSSDGKLVATALSTMQKGFLWLNHEPSVFSEASKAAMHLTAVQCPLASAKLVADVLSCYAPKNPVFGKNPAAKL
jgi:hypothetical protein